MLLRSALGILPLPSQAALVKRIAAAAASAYTVAHSLPSELNPVLRPLVYAVKKEPDLQRRQRR